MSEATIWKNSTHRPLVRVGVIPDMTVSACALDEYCYEPRGMLFDLAKLACRHAKLNCVFEWSPVRSYGGVDDDGNVTGMINEIFLGNYDTSLPIFTPTFERHLFVDFSQPYSYEPTVLVTRMPMMGVGGREGDSNNQWDTGIIQTFQWPVWCLVLLTVLGLCLLFHISEVFNKRARSGSPSRHFICWAGFFALFLSCTYNGVQLSDTLTKLDGHLPFKDLDTFVECVEQLRCRLITFESYTYSSFQMITESDNTISKRLQKTFSKTPIKYAKESEMMQKISSSKRKFLTVIGEKQYMINLIGKNNLCKFYMIETPLSDANGFPIRKGSLLKERLDRTAAYFRETGIIDGLSGKYFHTTSLCLGKYQYKNNKLIQLSSVENDDTIHLESIYFTLICYAVGLTLSVISLFIERYFIYWYEMLKKIRERYF